MVKEVSPRSQENSYKLGLLIFNAMEALSSSLQLRPFMFGDGILGALLSLKA